MVGIWELTDVTASSRAALVPPPRLRLNTDGREVEFALDSAQVRPEILEHVVKHGWMLREPTPNMQQNPHIRGKSSAGVRHYFYIDDLSLLGDPIPSASRCS
jgi:hypothetical protein